MDGRNGGSVRTLDGRGRAWLRSAFVLLVVTGIVMLQFFSFVASALGCGDDGPIDDGTATDVQRRFCAAAPLDSELAAVLVWSSPLVAFALVAATTRSTRASSLATVPFIGVTGVLPLALWINW